ncbi:MAG TPA: hypothetical protein VE973_01570 [Candidatus Limnocylindria bacterium]|nr:hypothetical protein [Candidatus Limnocylindria bacterium]
MMDKQTLLGKINQANITPELKAELLEMANAAEVVDANLLSNINSAIDKEAENLIEEIANAELQVQADKYDKQMQAVGEDVEAFVKDMGKKADEIDLEQARKQIK